MTNYYKNKIEAIRLIDKLVGCETPKLIIYYQVKKTFGFSEKFVDQHLELLHNLEAQYERNKKKGESNGGTADKLTSIPTDK